MELEENRDVSDDPALFDIGSEGVWTLSSAKMGNGIEQLRDGNLSSFWQYF